MHKCTVLKPYLHVKTKIGLNHCKISLIMNHLMALRMEDHYFRIVARLLNLSLIPVFFHGFNVKDY